MVETVYNTISVKISSPDGVMFVQVLELDNKPVMIKAQIGKAGSSLNAWLYCVEELINVLLQTRGLDFVIGKLMNITSDKHSNTNDPVTSRMITIKSSPQAIAYALIKYRNLKYVERMKELGILLEDIDDDDNPDNYRGAYKTR